MVLAPETEAGVELVLEEEGRTQDPGVLHPRVTAAVAAVAEIAVKRAAEAVVVTVTTDGKKADPDFSSLNTFRDAVWEVSSSKGFKDKPVTVATMVANIHGEVSELWESYRADTLEMPCDKAEKMAAIGLPRLTSAEEEIADIIIRALDTAKDLNIDIARAVAAKHEFNKHRPHRNGGKRA